MITYEYICENEHIFEVQQKITDEPLKECPTCKAKVQRLLSPAKFRLKGRGWYNSGGY